MTATVRPGLRRAISASTGGRLAARAAGAAGGVLCARLLGPELRGEYALLALAGTIVGTVASAGLHFWITRALAIDPKDPSVRGVIRRHLVTTSAAIGLLGLVVAALVPQERFNGAEVTATVAFAIGTVWSTVALAVPHGRLRMSVFSAATVVGAVAYLGWVAVLLAADVPSVAWVVTGAAVGAAIAVPMCSREQRSLVRAPVDRPTYLRALRFGWPSGLGELLTLASYRLDIFVVAYFLTTRDVGLYSVALALAEVVIFLPDGVALVVMSHAAGHPGDDRTRRVIGLTLVATAMGAGAVALASRPVLTFVFGDEFASARGAALPLLVGAVGVAAWKLLAADVVARGDRVARAVTAGTGVAVMLAADVILIPRFGIGGAAFASALGSAASALHIWWRWRRCPAAPVLAVPVDLPI